VPHGGQRASRAIPSGRVPASTGWSDEPEPRRTYGVPQPATPHPGYPPMAATTYYRYGADTAKRREWGLPAWAALLILVSISAVAGLIDYARGLASGGLFGYGVALGSLIAILSVRRSAMFPVVIAPPIVYVGGKFVAAWMRHQHFGSRTALVDIATNWLVFGFPAMAAATAAVLLIAGIRLITGR
jgi:uncharacterized protein DUF6542